MGISHFDSAGRQDGDQGTCPCRPWASLAAFIIRDSYILLQFITYVYIQIVNIMIIMVLKITFNPRSIGTPILSPLDCMILIDIVSWNTEAINIQASVARCSEHGLTRFKIPLKLPNRAWEPPVSLGRNAKSGCLASVLLADLYALECLG